MQIASLSAVSLAPLLPNIYLELLSRQDAPDAKALVHSAAPQVAFENCSFGAHAVSAKSPCSARFPFTHPQAISRLSHQIPYVVLTCGLCKALSPLIRSGLPAEYYPGNPVLKSVSMAAAGGQTLALVGATGSGKSTCLRLLFRCRLLLCCVPQLRAVLCLGAVHCDARSAAETLQIWELFDLL